MNAFFPPFQLSTCKGLHGKRIPEENLVAPYRRNRGPQKIPCSRTIACLLSKQRCTRVRPPNALILIVHCHNAGRQRRDRRHRGHHSTGSTMKPSTGKSRTGGKSDCVRGTKEDGAKGRFLRNRRAITSAKVSSIYLRAWYINLPSVDRAHNRSDDESTDGRISGNTAHDKETNDKSTRGDSGDGDMGRNSNNHHARAIDTRYLSQALP